MKSYTREQLETLNKSLAHYNQEDFLFALGEIAKEEGMNKLATATNYNVSTLYSCIAAQGNPHLETVMAVLHHLGFSLQIAPRDYSLQVRPFMRKGSLPEQFPTLCSYWDYDKNQDDNPRDFTISTRKKVHWKCKKGHTFTASPSNILLSLKSDVIRAYFYSEDALTKTVKFNEFCANCRQKEGITS